MSSQLIDGILGPGYKNLGKYQLSFVVSPEDGMKHINGYKESNSSNNRLTNKYGFTVQ